MKTRTLVTIAVVFFSLAPSALAQSCGVSGTCKAVCGITDFRDTAVEATQCKDFLVQGVSGMCCVPTPSPLTSPTLQHQQPDFSPCTSADGSECKSGICAAPGSATTKVCLPQCPAGSQPDPLGGCIPNTVVQPGGSTGNTQTRTVENGGQTGNSIPPTGSTQGLDIKLLNPLNSGTCTPNGDCLMSFLNNILQFIIRIGTVVVILMLVFVGYKFVVAQGEPAAITAARSALLWTVTGALILLGAEAISKSIEATVKALTGGG